MSVRKEFVRLLHEEMKKNEKILFVIGDLGYGHFDKIREEFPDRVFNPGAAEQLMLGMAVGMAQEGCIPVCYSASAGWSHWATDDKEHLSGFKNVKKLWPADPKEMEKVFQKIIYDNAPYYVNLSR